VDQYALLPGVYRRIGGVPVPSVLPILLDGGVPPEWVPRLLAEAPRDAVGGVGASGGDDRHRGGRSYQPHRRDEARYVRLEEEGRGVAGRRRGEQELRGKLHPEPPRHGRRFERREDAGHVSFSSGK